MLTGDFAPGFGIFRAGISFLAGFKFGLRFGVAMMTVAGGALFELADRSPDDVSGLLVDCTLEVVEAFEPDDREPDWPEVAGDLPLLS